MRQKLPDMLHWTSPKVQRSANCQKSFQSDTNDEEDAGAETDPVTRVVEIRKQLVCRQNLAVS